tara:strand:+ start:186 stop:527 length:342 start_codon:yes stop_codon:yes gene_type:complete
MRTNGVVQTSHGGRNRKLNLTKVMAVHPVNNVPEYASAIKKPETKKALSVPAVRITTIPPPPINQGSCSAGLLDQRIDVMPSPATYPVLGQTSLTSCQYIPCGNAEDDRVKPP